MSSENQNFERGYTFNWLTTKCFQHPGSNLMCSTCTGPYRSVVRGVWDLRGAASRHDGKALEVALTGQLGERVDVGDGVFEVRDGDGALGSAEALAAEHAENRRLVEGARASDGDAVAGGVAHPRPLHHWPWRHLFGGGNHRVDDVGDEVALAALHLDGGIGMLFLGGVLHTGQAPVVIGTLPGCRGCRLTVDD